MSTESSPGRAPGDAWTPPSTSARAADALRAFGLGIPSYPIPDGKIHRVSHCGDAHSDTAGWYVFHPDLVPRLAFGCWRCHPEPRHWAAPNPQGPRPDPGQLRRANARRARDIERARRNVADRTRSWLAQLPPAAASHPYLQRKGIRAHGALASENLLVLPLCDASGTIWSAQLIAPSPRPEWSHRDKSFAPGGRVSGCFHGIGEFAQAPCLVVCEGFATGATIAEVTGLPVACAMSAGNLAAVAAALTQQFPQAALVIAADHDRSTAGNPGLTAASSVASQFQAALAIPDFGDFPPAADASDFNDLRRLRGSEAVGTAFERPSAHSPPAPSPFERPGVRLPDAFGQEMPAFLDALAQALVTANASQRSPRYLARAGAVVLLLGHGRQARLVSADEHVLRAELQRDVRFLQRLRDGEGALKDSIAGTLPVALARDVARTPTLAAQLPMVDGIAGCPILDTRGTITTTGYAPEVQVVCACDPWPLDQPSLTEARDRLLDLLADFRFVSPADQSRALAALLQPALVLGGHVERGPALLVVADQPSTGKGTLVAVRGALYGSTAASITLRERGGVGSLDEDLSTLIAQGTLFLNIDNVRGGLRSQLLEACLTESLVSLRTPYRAATAADPRKLCLSITSNGMSLTPDLALRCNLVRLRKQTTGYRFRHRQPVGAAAVKRVALLSAVFAIMQDWISRGAPRAEHGFEGHARAFWDVADEIIPRAFGLPHPTLGLKEAVLIGANAFLAFLRELALILQTRDQIPARSLTAAQLLRLAADEGLPFDGHPLPLDDDVRLKALAAVFGRRATHAFRAGPLLVEDFLITQQREQVLRSPTDRALGTYESRSYSFEHASSPHESPHAPTEFQQWQQWLGETSISPATSQKVPTTTAATAGKASIPAPPILDLSTTPSLPVFSNTPSKPGRPDVVPEPCRVTVPVWWRDFVKTWRDEGRDRTRHGVQSLLSRYDCTLEQAVTAGWLEVTAQRVLLGPVFNQHPPPESA